MCSVKVYSVLYAVVLYDVYREREREREREKGKVCVV